MKDSRSRVLVVMPSFHKYESLIPDALERIGYDAKWTDVRPSNTFWMKFYIRIGLVQHTRNFRLRNCNRIINDAKEFGATTILLISPEAVYGPEIEQIKSAIPGIRVVLYLWDSSANRYLDQQMIDSSDAAYSSDATDCEAFSNLSHVPPFHCIEDINLAPRSEKEADQNFCFIGTARMRRIRILAKIARKLSKEGQTFYFYLFAPSVYHYLAFSAYAFLHGYRGILSRKGLDYSDYVSNMTKSNCVIDIEQKDQGGMTSRAIDAVFAGCPLMTSNKNIKKHDFFSHFPVHVFSVEKLDLMIPQSKRSAVQQYYFEKYHISTWLETILFQQNVCYQRTSF